MVSAKSPLEVCEMIGAYVGDGYFVKTSGNSLLGFAGDSRYDEDYLLYLKTICEKLFKKEFRIQRKTKKNEIYLLGQSKKIYQIMTGFGFKQGRKTRTITIPRRFLKIREMKKAVLKGFFDTDGFVYIDKRKIYIRPYPRIGLTTTSPKLAEQLIQILKELGFNRLYIRIDRRNGATNIEIYGKDQINKWIKDVGTSNQRHLIKLTPPVA